MTTIIDSSLAPHMEARRKELLPVLFRMCDSQNVTVEITLLKLNSHH